MKHEHLNAVSSLEKQTVGSIIWSGLIESERLIISVEVCVNVSIGL